MSLFKRIAREIDAYENAFGSKPTRIVMSPGTATRLVREETGERRRAETILKVRGVVVVEDRKCPPNHVYCDCEQP